MLVAFSSAPWPLLPVTACAAALGAFAPEAAAVSAASLAVLALPAAAGATWTWVSATTEETAGSACSWARRAGLTVAEKALPTTKLLMLVPPPALTLFSSGAWESAVFCWRAPRWPWSAGASAIWSFRITITGTGVPSADAWAFCGSGVGAALAPVPKLRTMDAVVTVTAVASRDFRQPIMDILSSDETSGSTGERTRILVGRVVARTARPDSARIPAHPTRPRQGGKSPSESKNDHQKVKFTAEIGPCPPLFTDQTRPEPTEPAPEMSVANSRQWRNTATGRRSADSCLFVDSAIIPAPPPHRSFPADPG